MSISRGYAPQSCKTINAIKDHNTPCTRVKTSMTHWFNNPCAPPLRYVCSVLLSCMSGCIESRQCYALSRHSCEPPLRSRILVVVRFCCSSAVSDVPWRCLLSLRSTPHLWLALLLPAMSSILGLWYPLGSHVSATRRLWNALTHAPLPRTRLGALRVTLQRSSWILRLHNFRC